MSHVAKSQLHYGRDDIARNFAKNHNNITGGFFMKGIFDGPRKAKKTEPRVLPQGSEGRRSRVKKNRSLFYPKSAPK